MEESYQHIRQTLDNGRAGEAEFLCVEHLKRFPGDVAASLLLVASFRDQLKLGHGLAVVEELFDRGVRSREIRKLYAELLYHDRDFKGAYRSLSYLDNPAEEAPLLAWHLDRLLGYERQYELYDGESDNPDYPRPLVGAWFDLFGASLQPDTGTVEGPEDRFRNALLWGPPSRRSIDVMQELAVKTSRILVVVPGTIFRTKSDPLKVLAEQLAPIHAPELVVLIQGAEVIPAESIARMSSWLSRGTGSAEPLRRIHSLAFFTCSPWWVPYSEWIDRPNTTVLPVLYPEDELRLDILRWCLIRQPNWGIRYGEILPETKRLVVEDIEQLIWLETQRVKSAADDKGAPVPIRNVDVRRRLKNGEFVGREWLNLLRTHINFGDLHTWIDDLHVF